MITAFCVLAEPDKLMYPYIESLRSVTHFADKMIINFSAAKEDRTDLRQFEKESYEKITLLKREVKGHCDVELIMDDNWKIQKLQSYDEIRNIVQRGLDKCDKGWFFKFDADNVFRKEKSTVLKSFFEKDTDKLIFRRINVINRNKAAMNNSSEDIYAINIDSLRLKNLNYKIGDVSSWCRAEITGNYKTRIISDESLAPVNYDATFFTRERIIDFWRRTEEAYSFAHKRKNAFENASDEDVLRSYKDYRKSKNGVGIGNFQHPFDMIEKMKTLSEEHWGYSNFSTSI